MLEKSILSMIKAIITKQSAFLLIILQPILCSLCNAAQSPNFILIFIDDMGFGDVGFNGASGPKTPAIDKMADKGKNTSGRGQRDLKVKVKSARGRKLSSTRWLQRQLNDPYVKRAQAEGYRGRAAFKIMELDDKYHFLTPGARGVDLGCAPGGWLQVAVPRVNALGAKKGKPVGRLIGVDLQEVEPIPGAEIHVLASDSEGFPNAMLEGMAHGLASIAFDIRTGPREISRNGKRAVLLEDSDQRRRLRDALGDLITNDNRRARLADAAVTVQQEYALATVLRQWDQLFIQVLGKARWHAV